MQNRRGADWVDRETIRMGRMGIHALLMFSVDVGNSGGSLCESKKRLNLVSRSGPIYQLFTIHNDHVSDLPLFEILL